MATDNPKISVIVPVYNVEKYLPRCIDSILAQTFTDFELLLIDDGSKDKSGEICDDYAEKDNRIRVFHKNNEGASVARNLGISESNGSFLVFVDSDDYLAENYLNTFNEILSLHTDAEMIIQSPIYVIDDRFTYKSVKDNVYRQYSGIKDFLKSGMLDFTEPHSKIFKKDIILDYHIRFPENVIVGEDGIFIANYLLYINCVVTSCKIGYYYVKSESSVQRKFYSPNVELRGVDLWKDSLTTLLKKFNFEINESFIWRILSVIIKRYCFAIAKNSDLTFKRKKLWLNMLDKDTFDFYGLGCNLTLKGKILKFLINRHYISILIIIIKLSK